MSDINNDPNSEQTIPSFVGQYRRPPDERIPQIVVIDLESELSKAEKRVSDFFKCTVNWNEDKELVDTSSSNQQKCFATRQTILYFETHLREKHKSVDQSFFCVYCYHSNRSSVKTYPHKYLIKHMLKRHRFRRFQCNLCLYRAITEEHVIIHQKTEHSSEYSKAITGNSQSSDDNICKIFVCPKVGTEGEQKEENRNLLYYWNKYKEKRLNSEGKNETYFQCIYCAFMDEQLSKVVEHLYERHADYPLLYYIPEPQVSSSTFIELVHDFSTYPMASVRPKLEPQDNCISSTQKSPETVLPSIYDTNNNSDNRRRISTDEEPKSKRRRVDSSDGSVSQTNSIQIPIQTTEEIRKVIICLFCEQTFEETGSAETHLKSHFDGVEDKQVDNWIQLFILRQKQLCSFTETDKSKSKKTYYYCPLCIKIAQIYQRFPKNYKNYIDVRKHLWDHCSWYSVKCFRCQTSIANCDPIIAKHFYEEHSFDTGFKTKFQFLYKNESDMSFTSEQRSQIEKKCLEIKQNSSIDKRIHQLSNQVKEDFERQLRIKNGCQKRVPSIQLERYPEELSREKFEFYFKEYKEYEERKEQKENERMCRIIDERCRKLQEKKTQPKRGPKKSSKSKETSGHKSGNNSKGSDKSTEQTEKRIDILDNISSVMDILREDPQTSGTTDANSVRNRLLSSESMEMTRESDTDFDEEVDRVSCFHCTDKFKSRKEFANHCREKHPGLPARMYAKPRK